MRKEHSHEYTQQRAQSYCAQHHHPHRRGRRKDGRGNSEGRAIQRADAERGAAVAASYAALGTKTTTLASAVAIVAADHAQLKLDEAARVKARTAVQGELESLRSLVVSQATGASDITGMGFTPLTPAPKTRTLPAAPAVVLVRPEKVHGRARAAVQETGSIRGSYVAESTPDPISPTSAWSPLPGNGKQRTIVGATGSKVWVRFAQVRYGLQSDWSTPVLVTLP